MNWLFEFFNILTGLGWMVVTPVFVALWGKAVGMRLGTALRCGVRISAALIGLTLIINRLGSSLTSVVADIASHHQLAGEVADAGWNASVAIASASRISLWIFPVYLVINWLMLLLRATRTLNLDLWNFWQVAFMGALVQNLTGSFASGMVAAGVLTVVLLVLADQAAPALAKYCQAPGVSVAHGFAASGVPFALLAKKLLDLVPGKPRLVLERSTRPRTALGSPAVWCGVLGAVMGFLAGWNIYSILQVAVTFAALAFLAPYMGQVLTDSVTPVAEAVSGFCQHKLKIKGNLYLGLSPAAALGNGTAVVVTLMLAIIMTFLAGVLPGNRFLVQGDIVMLPYLVGVIVAVCHGDLLRSLLAGAASSVTMLWCASSLAELFTLSAAAANPEVYGEAGTIVNLSNGANPLAWLTVQAGSYGVAGMALLVVVGVALAVWNRNRITGTPQPFARKKGKHIGHEHPAHEHAAHGEGGTSAKAAERPARDAGRTPHGEEAGEGRTKE